MHKRFVFGVLIGLAAGFLAAFGGRAADAQAKSPMTRWEQWCTYRMININTDGPGPVNVGHSLEPELKARGLEGWELAGISLIWNQGASAEVHYCFKRPLP